MIKLFHYDIHEYKLFQDELNKIAAKGYTTDKISYITFFKKTSEPTYFLVDIFTSSKKSAKRREEKARYIDYYLEADYEQISSFKNILVFKGQKELKERPISHKISQTSKTKRILQFFLSLLFLFFIITIFIIPLQSYHLLTDGKTLMYCSITLTSLFLCYRCYLRWNGIQKLSQALAKKENWEHKNIRTHYFLSSMIPMIIMILFALSFVIDILETQTLNKIPTAFPTLKDYDITEKTEYEILKRSSLIVPNSYEYVEYTANQKQSLYVQIYQLHNNKSAQSLLNDLINQPSLLYVEQIKKSDEHTYLGYDDHKAYVKIMIHDNTVTLITTNFDIK